MMYLPFNVVCQDFTEDFCISVHNEFWPVDVFSCGYSGVGLMPASQHLHHHSEFKISPPLSSEEFRKNWHSKYLR